MQIERIWNVVEIPHLSSFGFGHLATAHTTTSKSSAPKTEHPILPYFANHLASLANQFRLFVLSDCVYRRLRFHTLGNLQEARIGLRGRRGVIGR